MKLIVGLGNPGKEYVDTRHNIGFMVLDSYLNAEKWSLKFEGLYIEKIMNGEKIIFLKPQSYMNLSGRVVRKFADYFDIKKEDILVIHDDLDLNFAELKIKFNSSSGGHNGIKDIISALGTQQFIRLKIGISSPIGDTKEYVLSSLSIKEKNILKERMSIYHNVINDFIEYDYTYLMNKYNGLFK